MGSPTVQLYLASLFLAILVLVAIVSWLLPSVTRRNLLFGVTVPVGARASAAGRRMVRGYRLLLVVVTLVAALAVVGVMFLLPEVSPLVQTAFFVLAILLLNTIPYLWGYGQARALAQRLAGAFAEETRAGTQTATLRPRVYGDFIPWYWELLPVGIILATLVFLLLTYQSLPSTIPIHFGLDGTPDHYAAKSVATYFLLVWMQLGIGLLLTALTALLIRSKTLPGEAEIRVRRLWMRFLFAIKTLTLALMGAIALAVGYATSAGGLPAQWVLGPTLGFVSLTLGLMLVLVVRLRRIGQRSGAATLMATDHLDDKYWILGLIYRNPDDPSIFVERRFGMGWTINVGNIYGVLFIVALLIVAIGAPLAIVVLTSPR